MSKVEEVGNGIAMPIEELYTCEDMSQSQVRCQTSQSEDDQQEETKRATNLIYLNLDKDDCQHQVGAQTVRSSLYAANIQVADLTGQLNRAESKSRSRSGMRKTWTAINAANQ